MLFAIFLNVMLNSISMLYQLCVFFFSDLSICVLCPLFHWSIYTSANSLWDKKETLSFIWLFPNILFVFQSCLWHVLLYGKFLFLCSQICQSFHYGLCISYYAPKGLWYYEIIKMLTYISFCCFYCFIFLCLPLLYQSFMCHRRETLL